MLNLRCLGMSVFEGNWWAQTAGKGFPFIVLKPPVLLLPETMLWASWTAGVASVSFGISTPLPPILHSACKFFKPSRQKPQCYKQHFSHLSSIVRFYLSDAGGHPPTHTDLGHTQGAWVLQQVPTVPAARTRPTTCHSSPWSANKQRVAVLNAWMTAGRSLGVLHPQKRQTSVLPFWAAKLMTGKLFMLQMK